MKIEIENAEVMRYLGNTPLLHTAMNVIEKEAHDAEIVRLTLVPRNTGGYMCWHLVITNKNYEKRHLSLLSRSLDADFEVI